MASTDVRRPTRHRRQGSQAGARKDSAEIAGLLRLCILERRQIRAAMRTKHRGNAHWLGAKWAVPHAASRHNHSHRLPRLKYIKTGHRSEGSDDNHWSDHHCVCPVIVTVDHPVTSLDRAALPILFVHARRSQESADLPLWVIRRRATRLRVHGLSEPPDLGGASSSLPTRPPPSLVIV